MYARSSKDVHRGTLHFEFVLPAFNPGAQYKLGSIITLFARIDNLFDSHYATFGLCGDAREVLGAG